MPLSASKQKDTNTKIKFPEKLLPFLHVLKGAPSDHVLAIVLPPLMRCATRLKMATEDMNRTTL